MLRKLFSRFGFGVITFALASMLLATSGKAQSAPRDRIVRPTDSTQIAQVKGTAHPLARAEFDRGRLSPAQPLYGVSMTFRLSPAQQLDLAELLREQQNPSSPNYHKWLTPEQYASRFGMSQSDLAKVAAWLQAQGLQVESIGRNRNEISFSGSIGQIEYALKTEIHKYSIRGEEHFANSTAVSLPLAFSNEVLGVRGLNNFAPKPRVHPMPRFTSSVSGNHFLIPADFDVIYDVPSTLDGTGQTIAVVGQTTINTTDLSNFRSAAALPALTSSNFIQVQVPSTGAATACTGDETEADLDLEWSAGVAKNATIKYVFAGVGTAASTCTKRTANVFDALHYAITSNAAPVISISYGNCEANLGSSFVLTLQQWAQEANVQGQTISGPAGDTGAADCDTGNSATQGYAVDIPAAIPEVTGVGGSEFMGDAAATVSNGCASATQYWKAECNLTDSAVTAISYIPEQGWNDTKQSLAENPPGGLAAGGGGASTIFGKPSWQAGSGMPSDGKRDVPDISLNAGVFHDPYLICSSDISSTSCSNGFRDGSKNLSAVGGTSAGAPTFAAIIALLNQATSSNGLGNVNPMLYSIAAGTGGAFHDISSGNNSVPCTSGDKNCPAGTTSIGFNAAAGYDQVTGLGSLDVANLVTAWQAVTPAGDFVLDGLVSSSGAFGQAATSSVTVTALNGFTGTVNLTCGGGTKVSCSLNPTSVTLSGSTTSATSTLNMTASADLRLPAGHHPRGLWFAASGGIFAVAFLGGFPSRRKWLVLFALLLLAITFTAPGCGGSNHTPVQQTQGPQTFVVTVTGTGTNSGGTALSHTTNVSFTVQ
jgi:subtilase family serine protease